MAIYSDGAGIKYLGDCQWGTNNVSYPTQSYLQAYPHNDISAELTNLCTNAGLSFRNVSSQASLDALQPNNNLLLFGANGDINDRYLFHIGDWDSNTSLNGVHVYDNLGYSGAISSNRLYYQGNTLNSAASSIAGNIRLTPFQSDSTYSSIHWVGASDGSYLSLCLSQQNFGSNVFRFNFLYAGLLADVNSNYNYYSADNNSKSICFLAFSGSGNVVQGAHYISNAAKNILTSGDAMYPIVCSDSQSPTAQWATDFYAFDNNAALGYPAMGKVRGMLLGVGSYTTGKPVKLQGSVIPDNGSPWYLPVGTFGTRTLLMRCHSTMT